MTPYNDEWRSGWVATSRSGGGHRFYSWKDHGMTVHGYRRGLRPLRKRLSANAATVRLEKIERRRDEKLAAKVLSRIASRKKANVLPQT